MLSGSPTVNGTFNFTITATDSSTGNGPYGGSQAYSFQIGVGTPPVVGSVSVPANGYYRAGEVLSFTVNFNETVLVDTSGGSPSVPLVIGAATVDASYVSGSGSNALVFQYLVDPGDLDLNGIQIGGVIGLNGGAIANAFSTPADLALNNVGSTTGVLVDTIAPTATSSSVSGSPAPDAVAVDFLVTFSKPVNGVDSSDFVLTRTGSASGAVTNVATSDNVTYTVSVTGVSGTGSLRLDVLADGSITDTPGNPMTAAYASGTPWVRSGSSNASLAGLAPSAGALDPAFNAATFGYAVAVANSVASLTLTPTADDANATITVNGTAVASGNVSQPITLSVGATAIPVVVTAQDGATTRTYTVTVTRASPAPTVVSRIVAINAGQTASVELTDGATGGPFTGAAIIDISDSSAGSAHIEQNGQSFLLVFASSPTFSGGADVRFTLSSAHGTSAPGTISFTVLARPDPALDAEVLGLLRAQVDASKRFAQAQTRNFNGRLEQLHDEGDRRRNSLNVRLGYSESAERGDRTAGSLNEAGADAPGLLGYAPQSSGGASEGGLAAGKANGLGASDGSMDLGPYAIWTGGFVDFSQSDNGGIDLDGTLVGVSAGIDYRFSDRFIGGFGVGFGRDRTDIGANGTESTGLAYSAALYGSYKPADNFFIDGLIGASWLDFDSRRYITATGDFAMGSRSGQQVFGSLSAAYEFRDETWLLSPYGRIEMSRTWLDGFAEEGGGTFGLRYGDQTIDTVSGVIGLRAEYAFKRSWGTLTPGARIEYTHDFAGSSQAKLGYIDLDHLPYWLDVEASSRSYVTLGLSLDAELPQAWTLGVDYRTAFGNARQDHTFGLKVGKQF
ncbi:outer membrane autotransporter barrel domain-containing protein [Nitratireductor pacificus pht-3B]|uniref:Outer membrane autotransporter barrel domain-containing protein n=1 Tax=Nitratireductor pacificus pht-3B TaxID=391937 RepID=K2MN37_9HYPH|nr:outer membrane autotransporter barrel domain-containing protein [Nitratireductor pacificus pht-3B]